jgi:hypothetical protein
LWPTITKFDSDCGDLKGKELGTVKLWPTPGAEPCGMTATTSGRPIEKSTHLQTQVYLAEKKMWPTIRASDGEHGGPNQRDSRGPGLPGAVNLWATPQATNAHGKGKHGQGGDNLQTQCDGQLNPDWVESMVGLPIGWTNPNVKEISRENPNRWPSFMGQPQYDWEPPRTCGKMPNRAKRLKMCGNICIAQQIHPILRAIADIERSNYDRIA